MTVCIPTYLDTCLYTFVSVGIQVIREFCMSQILNGKSESNMYLVNYFEIVM